MLTLPNDGPATGRPLDTALTGDGAAAIVLAIARATPAWPTALPPGAFTATRPPSSAPTKAATGRRRWIRARMTT
ncbi:MAG: hypothetical protein R3D46_14365 [Defluviimonas denitrificans]